MTENNLPNYVTENRGIQIQTAKVDPNNPNTFTVSEEEGARLRTMAMSNSGAELTPEMQNAIDMTPSGYNHMIPDRIHNYICYDEAKKNNEKYRQEAEEFTNSIVKDNATKEILDEAEATTNLSQFDFGDISEYLEKLEMLSFLEAVSYKKKVDSEIARWKSCESMLKAISELKLDDTANRELMKINAMEQYNFMDSIDDFETHYDENMDKLNQIATKLASMINEHKHEMDSTKFLTNEMIHLMQGKIDKLDPSGLNYQYNKSRMEIVVDAFQNRLNLDYLSNKMDIYLKTNKDNIKRDFRENAALLNNGRRSKAINDLIRFFNEDITYAIYERLMSAFHDDVNATYLMMGFLAKVMNTEKKSSRNVWVKVFALNLSDIYNNIFDIEDASYMEKVTNTFYAKIATFLKNQKFNKSLNNGISFGLKTPVKKTQEIIPEETTITINE